MHEQSFPSRADVALLDAFPLGTVQVRIGDQLWRIRCTEDQHRLLAAAAALEHAPYGFLLWESSVALARWLATRPEFVRGKRVLELGAGVGLAGLVAQSLGASVTQTDHLLEALALAELNAADNDVEGVNRFIADWRTWNHDELYDVILGADILYETKTQPALASIFRRNLAPDGSIVLADPRRPQSIEFLGRLQHAGACAELAAQTVEATCAVGSDKDNVLVVRLLWP